MSLIDIVGIKLGLFSEAGRDNSLIRRGLSNWN